MLPHVMFWVWLVCLVVVMVHGFGVHPYYININTSTKKKQKHETRSAPTTKSIPPGSAQIQTRELGPRTPEKFKVGSGHHKQNH